jgi:trigger factor
MESTPVTLPESMVRAEVESRIRKLARYYNTDPNMLMQMMASGEGHEERKKEWRETAEKALHSRLIIETLMEEQNIEVTDADLEQELEKIAKENNVGIEEVKNNYDEQNMFYLKEDIKERRLIDIMLAENTLKQGKKENYLDFMSDSN